LTVEAWIYVIGTSGDNIYYTLMDHGSPNSGAGSSYDLNTFVLNGSFYFHVGSLSPPSLGVAGVVYNAWNHVSGCWNGTNTLYVSVNGTVASQAVTGTPAFFINGRRLSGALPYEEFKRVIDEELARRKKS
jgi:hypothetical protein